MPTSVDELTRHVAAAASVDGFGPEHARSILVAALTRTDDWLDPRYQRRADEQDWVLHPLYRAPDGRASMLVAVFRPGAASPVHDHGSWAVVGVYRGQERETRYRRGRGTSLEIDRAFVNPAGSVSVVPAGAIHSVAALGEMDAVSIHIYGTDIVTQERSLFDPAAGTESRYRPSFSASVGRP